MAEEELTKTVAFCGLICGFCISACQSWCRGCRNGDGTKDCYQRNCCIQNGLDGCWQCKKFPCDKGYFVDDFWKGLCTCFVQTIKDKGINNFVDLVESRLGKEIEYGAYRFKSKQDILNLLYSGTGK